MILSRRIALNGVALDSIHGSIVIRRIDAGVPHESIQAVNRMGGFGQRVTGHHWETLEVRVAYAVNIPKTDLRLRRQIFDDVNTWALGKGWLTVNFMPDRRMYVDKVVVPDMGDPREWTNEYEIVFRAYGVPFWQDETPVKVTASVTGSSTTQTIRVKGNVTSVLDVTFKNTSGSAMTTFGVTIGGKTMSLTGLSLASGKELKIFHGTDGLLRITADGTSVYGNQAGGGLEDLYVEPGNNSIGIAYGQAGDLTLECYGRYV